MSDGKNASAPLSNGVNVDNVPIVDQDKCRPIMYENETTFRSDDSSSLLQFNKVMSRIDELIADPEKCKGFKDECFPKGTPASVKKHLENKKELLRQVKHKLFGKKVAPFKVLHCKCDPALGLTNRCKIVVSGTGKHTGEMYFACVNKDQPGSCGMPWRIILSSDKKVTTNPPLLEEGCMITQPVPTDDVQAIL